MNRISTRSAALRGAVAVVAATSVALGLGLAASSASTKSAPHASKVQGGTAYFAEPPQATPNFIFPFMNFNFSSVNNLSQFQFLMYRPLFFFGNGASATLNTALSIANTPVFSNGNTVATVTLKPYKWSNGESVTAQDVVFWMNIMKVEKLNWFDYASGTIPDDVKSITAPNATTVVFTLTAAVNPYWYTYNELAQITPLPMAWDVTSKGAKSGSELCGTASYQQVVVHQSAKAGVVPVSAAAKSCANVYTFLEKESGYDPANPKAPNNSLSSYATNPLWQVVDGPWHLVAFNSTGYAAFKPNPSYSGPVKPSLSEFVELPFTSDTAEFNALVGGKVTVGYIPLPDVPGITKNPLVAGPNNPRMGNYNLVPWYLFSINYFVINFNSQDQNGAEGKMFGQLYFRQAMQELVDQPLYIEKIDKGYGVPTYGPVPIVPNNPFASKLEKTNPYPYSASNAINLLKSHGWTVNPNGTSVCNDASACGVPAGTQAVINLQYASGNTSTTELMNAEQASWAQAGIKVNLSTATFNTVIGNATPCAATSSNCTWDAENWGGGWEFSPDYYPTGEVLFQTGAGSDNGSYSNPTADQLIHNTDFANSNLFTYENFLARQLPVIWQPNVVYSMVEVQKSLQGAAPLSPFANILPENWYFTK